MTDDRAAVADATKGYLGTSALELSIKSDEELALWQSNHKAEPALQILADQEWQRRNSLRPPTETNNGWIHKHGTALILGILGSLIASAVWLYYGFV